MRSKGAEQSNCVFNVHMLGAIVGLQALDEAWQAFPRTIPACLLIVFVVDASKVPSHISTSTHG